MPFENLQAPNKIFNVSLIRAREVVEKLPNPRLYANQTGGGDAYMVPEKADQDNTGAKWVIEDGTTLQSLNVPEDLPIYLQVMFDGDEDYHSVGLMALGA